MARRLVGQDAEDLVQEALLNAYRHFDQLHDRDAASAWLATIMVNAYRDRVRAARRRVEEVDSADRFSLYHYLATPSARPALAPAKPCSTWAAGAASFPSWPPAGSAPGPEPLAA